MELLAGSRLAHYEIIAPLGQGGMGQVYLAQDTKLGRRVAIKLLSAEFTQEEDRIRRFQQEARAASALNHPNILTIYEVGQVEANHYIATEYIEGQTLRRFLAHNRTTLHQTLEVAGQIATALTVAHAAGIVHRDIKPENIMLRADGFVKVLDFGLAKLTEQAAAQQPAAPNSEVATVAKVDTDPGTVMGTVAYMSPEQTRGLKLDARSDIFSFGVVLYEMIAGRVPFEGATASDIIAAILKTEPLPLTHYAPEMPAELQRIVGKALEKDLDERYQTIKDLQIDLKRLKRRLDADVELERAIHPAPTPDGAGAGGGGAATGAAPAVSAGDAAAAHTSSAEVIIGEIKRHKKGAALVGSAFVIVILGVGFGLSKLVSRSQPKTAGPAPKVVPFTTYPGFQYSPDFSPDGNQIAFYWNGEKEDNYDIYVRLVDGGPPLRLTTHLGADTQPVWAPDGRSLSFYRSGPEARGYYKVSALGGAERLLAEAKGACYGYQWSPDGKSLIVSEGAAAGGSNPSLKDPAALYAVSIETGERRKLTTPPAGQMDIFPAVSPDGKNLAFFRRTVGNLYSGDLFLMPLEGGAARQLTFNNTFARSLAWSADGNEIIFLTGEGGNPVGLWRVPVAGGTAERIGTATNLVDVAVARRGDRLAFAQQAIDLNIYRVALPRQAGQAAVPARFISSTLNEASPQYSPDGKRIVFSSNRSGSSELWVCDSDGTNAVQLTFFGKSVTTGTPRWSPDGRKIAFDALPDGQVDVYVISADGGAPRRLTQEPGEDMVPSWSRDGRSIYFCSDRSGRLEVWKLPAEGGPAVQVTMHGGFESFESFDGKFLYYAKGRNIPGIWKVPVDGGAETPVVETDQAGLWRNWALTGQGIYFSNNDNRDQPVVEFFNFATAKVTKLATLERPMQGNGIALSPDGKWLLFTAADQNGANIMLMENFR